MDFADNWTDIIGIVLPVLGGVLTGIGGMALWVHRISMKVNVTDELEDRTAKAEGALRKLENQHRDFSATLRSFRELTETVRAMTQKNAEHIIRLESSPNSAIQEQRLKALERQFEASNERLERIYDRFVRGLNGRNTRTD